MTDLKRAVAELRKGGSLTLSSVPEGFDAFCVADLAQALAREAEKRAVVCGHGARDDGRARSFNEAMAFAAPGMEIIDLPGWDCQPYDRVSPNASVSARRMTALARLARTRSSEERPRLLSTSVAAMLQRVPPLAKVAKDTLSAAPGNALDRDDLVQWLEINGFTRSTTVRDTGEYAVRGGILDLFAPALAEPIRLDFFGDTLESIRTFDPETQRTSGQLRGLDLVPMSEVQLTTEAIKRFRHAYTAEFGGHTRGDTLYEAVSEGRRSPGFEHWLPLFYEKLDTIFSYIGGAPLILDPQVREAAGERLAQIDDYHDARRTAHEAAKGNSSYKPLPPDALYLDEKGWTKRLAEQSTVQLAAYGHAETRGLTVDAGGRLGRNFAPERADESKNVFEATAEHVRTLQGGGKHVIVAAWSEGSRERLAGVLADHGLKAVQTVSSLSHALHFKGKKAALAVFGLEEGFETDDLAVISEQDILGDRLVRKRKNAKRSANFLTEIGSIAAGDIIVHAEHGIGRFTGLHPIEAAGVRHDCLELHYADGVKLYLPVENLELLSRYGSEDTEVQLDRLGGAGWQKRKARMRKRVLEMAAGLIQIAAARATKEAPRLVPPEGLYAEFCANFPYDETEDQLSAIDATLEDMASGRPMDRLICGDVGFGKTEVAMRGAFAAAINGKQVVVVAPTTLLARQHFKGFTQRFAHLPIKVMQLSRMASAADLKEAKAGLASGAVDIIVGTHAVLGKGVAFKDLGLVIVDEEQHFGVKHKERLKDLRAEVHVLTLSATPIPRTLQLAMSGVRDLSIIATPPVDRLTVRTSVSPFDELLVREALLRERYRGGQSFYVCPRIEYLDDALAFLRQAVPEAKVVVAHGQMPPSELEDKMSAFYEGKYDILLSTTIVESGLDIPTANTLIVHRADMFGLSQLYQLRGRVGRSKTRAYALLTLPANKTVTAQAERRLKVLDSLDTLGAGFQLASHDLDIRGAGNLLGDEQSGHIKEVGYELYQAMLQDAIEALKLGIADEPPVEAWSPQIQTGTPVTIPDTYVEDPQLRVQLYRRMATLEEDADIEGFAAELIDRFGPMPTEVDQLMKLVSIKALCRRAHVEKVDAGPKGVIIAFRDNAFANPQGLVRFVTEQGPEAKVRPDMKVVFIRDFGSDKARLEGTRTILRTLAAIATKKAA